MSAPLLSKVVQRSFRFFALLVVLALALGFITAWAPLTGFILTILGAPTLAVTLVVGTAFQVIKSLNLAEVGPPWSRAANVLIIFALAIATVAAVLPAHSAGSFVGTWTRLLVNRSHYEEIIARVNRGEVSRSPTSPGFEELGGIVYVVDRGPPIRIAFNPEGIQDNWSGIVFDPTHQVMLAAGLDERGRFLAPEQVTTLFGGDLVECRRLTRDFFHCAFT